LKRKRNRKWERICREKNESVYIKKDKIGGKCCCGRNKKRNNDSFNTQMIIHFRNRLTGTDYTDQTLQWVSISIILWDRYDLHFFFISLLPIFFIDRSIFRSFFSIVDFICIRLFSGSISALAAHSKNTDQLSFNRCFHQSDTILRAKGES